MGVESEVRCRLSHRMGGPGFGVCQIRPHGGFLLVSFNISNITLTQMMVYNDLPSSLWKHSQLYGVERSLL